MHNNKYMISTYTSSVKTYSWYNPIGLYMLVKYWLLPMLAHKLGISNRYKYNYLWENKQD